MDDHFLSRLTSAENDFMSAMLAGEIELLSYELAWKSLLDEISQSSALGVIDGSVLAVAHDVAYRITTLADCFLDIQQKNETCKAELHNDLDTLLDGLQLEAGSRPPLPSVPLSTPPSTPPSTLPPFIASAYSWLLENIHNPYPSSETKNTIARASGCSMNSLNSWFINVRRRMGWTRLCREKFSNCRADAIDAACRALVKEDPNRKLSPEVAHSFMVMKVTAEELYSSAFTKSALAWDLDIVVKDMTEEDGKFTEGRRGAKQQNIGTGRKLISSESRFGKDDCETYPSPRGSRTPSPVPSLVEASTDDSEDEEDVLPPTLAGRKRRRQPSIESANPSALTNADRPGKRRRSSRSTVSPVLDVYLPSPPSSVDSAEDLPGSHLPAPTFSIPVIQTHSDHSGARKRRLSDTSPSGISKRPRGGPRLHVVSDPLPRSQLDSEYSIDEWFSTNFDALFAVPPPVDAVEPDLSAQLEVQLFSDYNIPQHLHKRSSKSPSPVQVQDTRTSTQFAGIEDLLQSIENNTFVAPPETSSSTVVTSHDIPSDLAQPINWTALLDGTGTFVPTIDSLFPQPYILAQPLSEIDLSIIQLPPAMATATASTAIPGDVASKQVKLRRLQEMQEAVRRMEKELQSEGVSL